MDSIDIRETIYKPHKLYDGDKYAQQICIHNKSATNQQQICVCNNSLSVYVLYTYVHVYNYGIGMSYTFRISDRINLHTFSYMLQGYYFLLQATRMHAYMVHMWPGSF